MQLQHATEDLQLQRITSPVLQRSEEKGAIGVAFLVWLFGGGLGLAVLVFLVVKMC